ncbi:EAL domain-containing protein [Thiorhodococcus mannitoliphagus]|uniref:cyclic-guanylate-specific phosphodiesterase n=2 Tax=Thiorhodococcus mannitoliphagus TaxID=329406 RepID=A0A6P1E0U6_9GAMM|nr:EAL domain-containing protein [Thiorhodococcus mannitoliphagus]
MIPDAWEPRGLLSAVLETIEELIIGIDASGHLLYVNPAAQRVLQQAQEPLLGQPWTAICTVLGLDIAHLRETDPHRPFPTLTSSWRGHLRLPSGAEHVIAWRARQVADAEGTTTSTLLVGTALTPAAEPCVIEKVGRLDDGGEGADPPSGRCLPPDPQKDGSLFECVSADKQGYFQALLDNFPFQVWLKDRESRFLAVNRAFAQSLGAADTQALIGKCDDDVFPPDLAERHREVDRAAMRAGTQIRVEEERLLQGRGRWLEIFKSPAFDTQGQIVGSVGFARDISTHKQTEEALLRKHEQLRLVLDHAPIGIWLTQPDGRIELANRAFCEAIGVSEEALRAAPHYTELLPAELSVQCERSDAKALATQEVCISQEHFPFADGRVRDMTVIKYLHRDARGTPEILLGISLDITEERVKAHALRESEARANSILRAAPVGIAMLKDRVLRDVNETLLQMMGYRRAELIGQTTRLLYPSDEAYQRLGQEIYQRLGTDRIGSIETQLQRKDGRVLDMMISWAPMDAADPSKGITFSLQDITSQKEAERALRESEVKFHTMVDWTIDWEYWLLPDGSLCYMTPSAEALTGYRVADFVQSPALIEAIVHPEDRSEWDHHLQSLRCTADPRHPDQLDFRLVQRSGQVIWVTHRCRAVFDAAGIYQGRRVTVRDVTAQKAAEEQVRRLAYFDPLTALPNRRLLLDRLGHALSASTRSQEYGALLMLDLDQFKALNDTQGHAVGDKLLIEVAQRLQGAVRGDDTVSRLGGDEYIVLIEGLGRSKTTAATHAEGVAEHLWQRLIAPYSILEGGGAHHATASIGVTLFQGQTASIDVLLKQADLALYQAKDAGRNAVRFFDPRMQAAVDERMAMEKALRQALEEGELCLFYQPQHDRAGRCIGAEALLRWRRPGQGLVSPMTFIPLAEETGLILPIGRWVLDTACAQLKTWAADPATRDLQLAVNVSARQFHQPDFLGQVRESLLHSGADPTRLKLELTESIVLENVEAVIERMQALKALGVSFSLDDFGTGYSSLSYLKRLLLDQLKIDKSFVQDLTTDPNDAAIVEAILAMSRSLGLQVVAEGVETSEQHAFLLAHGCDAFQGYLFGRPLPIADWRPSDAAAAAERCAPE